MKPTYFILPVIILILIYITKRKIQPIVQWSSRRSWILTIALFAIMLPSHFIYRNFPDSNQSTLFQILSWTGGILTGLWVSFLLLLVPFDLIYGISLFARRFLRSTETKLKSAEAIDQQRRILFTRYIPTSLLGISGAFSILGLKERLGGPQIRRVQIPVSSSLPDLRGFKIAQISDLHVGPTILKDYVVRVVDKVQSLGANVIAVTGDLADGTPQALKDHIAPLKNLNAPLGVFYITGNHEYYWNAESWIQACQEMGMRALINSHEVIDVGQHRVMIAGITDSSAHQFIPAHASDPVRAVAMEHETPDSKIDYRILLAHRPDSCLTTAGCKIDLQLSGHTHAGQFFPWNLLMPFAHRYYQGLNRHEDTWVYVNAGTGYWGPPNRFAIPSEITLIEFV